MKSTDFTQLYILSDVEPNCGQLVRYSKVVAKKKAWELAKGKDGFSVSVICPSFILGPMMTSRTDGESVKFMKAMLEGTAALKGFPVGVVDVRDVSLAHVTAMERQRQAAS